MSQSPLSIRGTLQESLALFRRALPGLLKFSLPFVALSAAIDLFTIERGAEHVILLGVLSSLVTTLANVLATRCLLAVGFEFRSRDLPLTAGAYLLYLFVTSFVVLVSAMGFMLLFVPGVLLYAWALLAPVIVLHERLGPIAAIAKSVELMQGNLWRIVGMVVMVWVFFALAGSATGWLLGEDGTGPLLLTLPIAIVSSFAALLMNAIAVATYIRLQPNPTVNLTTVSGALFERAAPRGCRLPPR